MQHRQKILHSLRRFFRQALLLPFVQAPQFIWRVVWPLLGMLRIQWIAHLGWIAPIILWLANIMATACVRELPGHLQRAAQPHLPANVAMDALKGGGVFLHWVLGSLREADTAFGLTCLFLAGAVLMTFGGFLLSLTLFAPLHVRSLGLQIRSKSPVDKTHGSACWETPYQAKNAGFFRRRGENTGMMLGRARANLGPDIDPRYMAKGHILTCAPTGAGKGIGCVIPNLLQYPGSAFVLDLKGENYAATAGRRIEMGATVARLDPFGISGKPSHAFNWLDGIDTDDDSCIGNAAQLAETLIIRGSGVDSHWDDSAQYLLQGLILYAASRKDENSHMGYVRTLLTLGEEELRDVLERLCTSDIALGRVGRMARTFLAKEARERASVLSTALRHTTFLDDPQIERTLRGHSFGFGLLKTSCLTVYLIMPPSKLSAYSRYVRAILMLALQAMVQNPQVPKHNVVFFLDEVAQLGYLAPLEDAVTIMRGYGVQLWLLIQDLGQLKHVYRKWQSFLASSTLQFFAVQDNETARYVSEALGNETVWVRSTGQTSNQGVGRGGRGRSSNRSSISRPLLTAEEVRTLPGDEVLVFSAGRKPQRLRRLNYLQDPETRQGAKQSSLRAA